MFAPVVLGLSDHGNHDAALAEVDAPHKAEDVPPAGHAER